ncbi:MAG: gfo/Idh/MocA family oxidoreductase, partial [Armatimonadota bacterium]
VYGSDGSLAWNHERSAELWLGHRNGSNEIFFESPNLQDPSTRQYAKLPSGHPMGYMDAVLNLFSDFYKGVSAKRAGNKSAIAVPDFKAGHTEMLILEAAIRSKHTGSWAKVEETN